MNDKDKTFSEQIPERYVPLDVLTKVCGLSKGSLKHLLHLAKQRGVPLPERRKIRRLYYYDRQSFNAWLWEHGSTLRCEFNFKQTKSTESNESNARR